MPLGYGDQPRCSSGERLRPHYVIDHCPKFDPQSPWHVGMLSVGANGCRTEKQETNSVAEKPCGDYPPACAPGSHGIGADEAAHPVG
jgi:hypothetical protein